MKTWSGSSSPSLGHLSSHLQALLEMRRQATRMERWGAELGHRLMAGGRLLAAGNGGSAAQAQHLCAELVGRFVLEKRPLSAIALNAETSSLTAITNDYGFEQAYARQVLAHGREGDVIMLFSCSGESPNVLAAAAAADRIGMTTWALTGPEPNSLARMCDEVLSVLGPAAIVQEIHLVAIHLLCQAVDQTVASRVARPAAAASA